MTSKFFALAAVSVLGAAVAVSSPAFASEQQEGSYYFRAGLGYNFSKLGFSNKSAVKTKKEGDSLKGPLAEFGIGYVFSKNIRADLSVRYISDSGKGILVSSFGDMKYKFKQTTLAALVNAYYQFSTDSAFSPYLVAGVGVQSVKNKLSSGLKLGSEAGNIFVNKAIPTLGTQVTKADLKSLKSKSKTGFMYKVGAGFSYEIDQGIFLDMEYNLTNRKGGNTPNDSKNTYYSVNVGADGKTTNATTAVSNDVLAKSKLKDKLAHTVMVGVRVNF